MKIIAAAFVLAFASSVFAADPEPFVKKEVLVIHQILGGLDYKTEVAVESASAKIKEFQLKGFAESWSCGAFVLGSKNEVIVTCHLPEGATPSFWKIQSSIYCDSEDSMFIDAVTIKCRGKNPVRFWGK
jgi:hypothetical protein